MAAITRIEFTDLYNGIKENFKGMDSIAKLTRCYNYVADLPKAAVKQIIEDMIDNERNSPLPKDFEKYARQWKSKFYQENGYYYGESENGAQVIELPDCAYCLDTGINKITKHDDKAFKQLMRCDCKKGDDCPDLLPAWTGDLSAAFIRDKIDAEWFNPKIGDDKTDKTIYSLIWAKVKEWQNVRVKAVMYWRNLGYMPEVKK